MSIRTYVSLNQREIDYLLDLLDAEAFNEHEEDEADEYEELRQKICAKLNNPERWASAFDGLPDCIAAAFDVELDPPATGG